MKAWMLGALIYFFSAPTVARAVPRYDISPMQQYLLVEHDSKGHYIVHTDSDRIPRKTRMARPVFYGDGKVFYELLYRGASRNSPKRGDFSYFYSDPRIEVALYSTFRRRHGESEMECGVRKTGFTRLPEGEAKRLVAKAKFYTSYWRRRAELLARDDDGRYFYVDYYADLEASKVHRGARKVVPKRGFRLYIGPRGQMKRVKLKNLVVDPAGEVFITAKGKLKRVASTKKVTWIEGTKTLTLTPVPLRDVRTRVLIYRHLGPYRGARMWLPCDDL